MPLACPLHLLKPIVELIEGPDGQVVEGKARKIEGNDARRPVVVRCQRPRRRPVGAGERPPSLVRRAVDPGNSVLVGIDAFGRERPEFLEALERRGLDVEDRARDRREPELHPLDKSREAKAADRRAKELRLCILREHQPPAVAADEAQRGDARPERARAVMVLAVDVVRDRPSQRDKARARRRGQKPAARDDDLKRLGNADPGLGAQVPLSGSKAMRRSSPVASMSAPSWLRHESP